MQFCDKHMMQLFFVDAEDWIFIILWREKFFDARLEHNIDLFSVNIFFKEL